MFTGHFSLLLCGIIATIIASLSTVNGSCLELPFPLITITNQVCTVPTDCKGWQNIGINQNGVYYIQPDSGAAFQVYCDMETDGGGWTVFQRRQDGSVDFYRSWTDYENGFGDLSGEFWLGLSKIHRLTSKGMNTLQIKIGDFEGNSYYAQYSTFSIGDASTEYRLNVSGYNSTGTAGDSLLYHNGSSFGTKDNVNDEKNCPIHWNGGWWFSKQIHCFLSHLNGRYEHQPDTFPDWSGVIWNSWKSGYTLKNAEMKIR